MRVEWHGQSAFTLTGGQTKVFIDPFGDMSGLAADRGIKFEYPEIDVDGVDLLLITHEHVDHNGVEGIGGDPAILRSTAGRLESPLGEVVAIASEHDDAAGTERGPNTIFAFDLDGVRVAHFGDFGQSELRPEQAGALEGIDLVFLPVGAGPTIGAEGAAEIVKALEPRWVVPMHYRTPRTGFLETEEEFVSRMPKVERPSQNAFETAELPNGDGPTAVVPAAP
ncbi:MAG TPA: MBL fold metallo-hydrolase [Solirubrobacterales bacterium]|jgi:L-ascorbate metabolism protein UlaG (beta-lactamase superfamily)|nr:MBL fold metallo-hydrolase [Solirubrobacterales bacterium]